MATLAASFDEAARIIRAMDQEFIENVKSGDAVRLVEAFYAEDARVLPPNRPPVTGKASILELWRAFLASGVTALDLNTTEVAVSGDLAYGVGGYSMTLRPPGAAETSDQGKYVVVYRRQADGAWKAVVDMFSSNGQPG